MRNVPVILKRELMAYFLSPLAYIVTILFLVVMGLVFGGLVAVISTAPKDVSVIQIFFRYLTIIILLAVPIITMRLYAEEKNSGTVEVLMTAPVKEIEVVLGKYLAVLLFFIFMCAPTVMYVFIFRWFSRGASPMDMGPIWAGYLGILLMAMLMLAIGFLCSSFTKSQVLAAILAFVSSLGFLILVPLLSYVAGDSPLLNYFSPTHHIFEEFSIGWIDVRRIVFYVSATAWVLFLTGKIIESRKWK